jgi:hypothetical protein
MPSATEPIGTVKPSNVPRFLAGVERWNRKLHFYSGLFLLFFLWLFAFTGLILNHPAWSFAESWTHRKETNYVREIAAPGPEVKGNFEQAREIQKQLGMKGEILWTATTTNAEQFDFQVRRPGYFYFIKADLARKRVTVRQANVNLWGVVKVLHTFTGFPTDDTPKRRNWVLTSIWAYSMDAVAAGLVFMVLSSLYMWFKLPQKRLPGAVVIGFGLLNCGLFCIALRWLF